MTTTERDHSTMTMIERDELVIHLLKEVSPMLRNFARWGFDFDDLYQEASLIVLSLVESLPDAPIPFAVRRVQFYTLNKIQYWRRRQHESLDAPLNDTGVTLADLLPDEYRVDPLVILLARERLQELAEKFTTRPVRPLTKGQIARFKELHETALAGVTYA